MASMRISILRSILLTTGFVFITGSLFFGPSVFAQEDPNKEAKKGFLFSPSVGSLLPNQIEGVTEVLPVWGFRFGHFNQGSGMLGGGSIVEYGAFAIQSLGVNYYNGFISLRGNIPMEDLEGIVYIGIDVHYYKSPNFEFRTAGGGHFGGGINAKLSPQLWFRSDMKFHVNPGTSLYIGFGFEFLIPESPANAQATPEPGKT